MNKKILGVAAIPVLGISIFAADAVSAHYADAFIQKASMHGIDAEQAKQLRAMHQKHRIEEKGVSKEVWQQRSAMHRERKEAHMKALVEQGVITQEQADAHMALMHRAHKKGGGFVHR